MDHGWSYPATSHIRKSVDKVRQKSFFIRKNFSNLSIYCLQIMRSYGAKCVLTVTIDFSNVDYIDFSSSKGLIVRKFVLHNYANAIKAKMFLGTCKAI